MIKTAREKISSSNKNTASKAWATEYRWGPEGNSLTSPVMVDKQILELYKWNGGSLQNRESELLGVGYLFFSYSFSAEASSSCKSRICWRSWWAACFFSTLLSNVIRRVGWHSVTQHWKYLGDILSSTSLLWEMLQPGCSNKRVCG